MDPESLATILIANLDESNNYIEPLVKFQDLVSNYSNFCSIGFNYDEEDSKNYITLNIPLVVKKVLGLVNCNDERKIISFILICIRAIAINIDLFENYSLVSVLSEIVNPDQNFYLVNGRDDNSPFSRHLIYFADYLINSVKIDSLIFDSISTNDISITEFNDVILFFQRLCKLKGSSNVFQNAKNISITLINILKKFTTVIYDEPKKIPIKQLSVIVPNLLAFWKEDDVVLFLLDAIKDMLKIDIIDIRVTAIKFLSYIYSTVLTSSKLQNDMFKNTFCSILVLIQNFECLSIIKPALIKYADRNLIDKNIVESLLTSVKSQHLSFQSKAYDLFIDIAIKINNPEIVLDVIKEEKNVVDIYGKLIKGSQYIKIVSEKLLNFVENYNDFNAFDKLLNISKSYDSSNILNQILSNYINNLNLFDFHLYLIDSILQKSKQVIDIEPIINILISNPEILVKENYHKIVISLTNILQNIHKHVTKDLFQLLLNKSNDDSDLIFLFQSLFLSSKQMLIDEGSKELVCDSVKKISNNLNLFEILRILYSNVPENETKLHEQIMVILWDILLNPSSNKIRKEVSDLLLSDIKPELVPSKLCCYVEKCLQNVMEIDNKNSAIFIQECLSYVSKYVNIKAFGIEEHRFFIDDKIEIKIKIFNKIETIRIEKSGSLYDLTQNIASSYNIDINSIVLYYSNNIIPLCSQICEFSDDKVIEVRIKNIYEPAPHFNFDNHPISIINNRIYLQRLMELLKSSISEDIYKILIQVPTPDFYKLLPENISLSYRFLFIYQLHYLVKHLEHIDNKNEIFDKLNSLKIDEKFCEIEPEAQYLFVLLNINTSNKQIINIMLCLYKETPNKYLTQTLIRLWNNICNLEFDLSEELLTLILKCENPLIIEISLNSKLIQKQNFSKIWNIFKSQSSSDKIKLSRIFKYIIIPDDLYQNVIDEFLPLFSTLDDNIISIFVNISTKMKNFPANKISQVLIDSYILCNSSPPNISSPHPYQLLLSIIQNDPENRNMILDSISKTMPSSSPWNYKPNDLLKNVSVGLSNLGSTCYINAIIQQIFHIKPLKDIILSTEFHDSSMIALHDLFTEMEYSNKKYIDMNSFISNWCDWNGEPINPKEQQDANEFLTLLLSRLEVYPNIYSLISGQIQTHLFNEEKNYSSISSSNFNSLSLVVMNQNCIKDSLELFEKPEIIENYKIDDAIVSVNSQVNLLKLSPYLFIQLKRFDYSIETYVRNKINQYYQFEDEIDFKQYLKVSNENQETRYTLKGVVIHQGDADYGHYYSYLHEDNHWICLNDKNVSIVTKQIMNNEAFGNEENTSAYILLYERVNADELDVIDKNTIETINSDLISKIQKCNHSLIVDNIFYSQYFAEFIINLLKSDTSFQLPLNYYLNTLSHSSNENLFAIFSEILKEKMHNEENLQQFILSITENPYILEIMTQCSSPSIRHDFASIIQEAFTILPPENQIFIYIIINIYDWIPAILINWRNSFDIFQIISDYLSVSNNNFETLKEFDILSLILSLFTDKIPEFVQDKGNNISADRFSKSVDMTSIIDLLRIMKVQYEEISNEKILKWLIPSEKHTKALVRYIFDICQYPSSIESLIEKSSTNPSEALVLEFIKSKIDFKVPTSWTSKIFNNVSSSRKLLVLMFDWFRIDFNNFQLFVEKQSFIFTSLLFYEQKDIREKFVDELYKISNMGPMHKVLFPLINNVLVLSQTLYLSNEYRNNFLPLDYFFGLDFVRFLSEIAPSCDNLNTYYIMFQKVLNSLNRIEAKRDEHAIGLVPIGILMMKSFNVSNGFILDIQAIVQKMVPDHKQLDSTLRSYFNACIYQINNNPELSPDTLIPQNNFKDTIFKILLQYENNMISSKSLVIDILYLFDSKFCQGAKICRLLSTEIQKYKNPDIESVLTIISKYKYDTLVYNLKSFDSNTIKQIINLLFDRKHFYPNLIALISNQDFPDFKFLMYKEPLKLKIFTELIQNNEIDFETRKKILSGFQTQLIYLKDVFSQVYGDLIISNIFNGEIADIFVSKMILIVFQYKKTIPNWREDEFAQKKIAMEFCSLIRDKNNSLYNVSKSFETVLCDVTQKDISILLNVMVEQNALEAIVDINLDEYIGINELTELLFQSL